ncbi:SpvB/TcaC N-terminal domain-containing protein [Acrocarpospora phusangensis]|uniref:SpvB/TcaC N-terminal domain-containing protein n=1 Tax=Acrocarpospora phusangensis TaxID=1070424 RepID=UPI00195222B5|nr:SpvB/TcaC N-terminal domain-containing protein [Acrocarpospora phusangensis]
MDDQSYPGSSGPSIRLPKGGGAIRGVGEKFAANPVTGTATMDVPLAVSPGRSGFGPQPSLSYDSGAGNGPFGFGWSLSLPSITRQTDKGLPRYHDAADPDVFVLSGAEDLVPVLVRDARGTWERENLPVRTVDGAEYRIVRYRPRVEGLFARIECWTNTADPGDVFWRSISSDNITTWYGKTAESRIADPADRSRVFSWLICQSHDDKGNAIVYGYKSEDSARIFEDAPAKAHERNRTDTSRSAQRYLKHIRYGNRSPYFPVLHAEAPWPEPPEAGAPDGSDAWHFEVVFDYGEHDAEAPAPHDAGPWQARQDPFSTYRAGFEVRSYRICRRVLMFHHFPGEAGVERDCLVRSTDFTYSDHADPTDVRDPVHTFLRSVTQTGYRRRDGGYDRRGLPPVEFEYTEAIVRDTVEDVDPGSLENLPAGVDGSTHRWTDLHGEGIPGVLTEQAGAWFYKRNLSPVPETRPDGGEPAKARLAPLETVLLKPGAALDDGAELMDLAGDGLPDVVVLEGPTPGLYEHDDAEGWQLFRPFASLPIRDFRDPNLRFVDLDGDGHADVLITEDDAFVWHASLAEDGFGPARRVAQALDEEKGPRIVFADATQGVYLADLSGDGLTDIVRIRNGEVCYWPNLGYGRFGAKVAMDNAPWFDQPDQFDHRRVRLADIDGSGTADLIYLHRDGVRLYFNQSGNSWSRPRSLEAFPRVDDLAGIVPVDLLGNGTACLVWSSPLPGDARRPMRYVDLMGGRKPHLLVRAINNLGAETRVDYAPSTKFYLRDKRDGKPWVTRLPFPVHVVERVETVDHLSRNRFVVRYAYHHGSFDGVEREFRGFGMVEQWDTERLAVLAGGDVPADGIPADDVAAASHVPPVHTKTWFHTGVYLGRDHVSDYFAGLLNGTGQGEYFREPGLTDAEARDLLLPDTVLPAGLTHEEEREACRALKGAMLRQEVYADDAAPDAAPERIRRARTPYTVTEQNFTIRALQPRGANRHAVFLTNARETISYHYERDAADPRVQHALTLEVDDHGNVLKQAAVGYGRRTEVRTVDAAGIVRRAPNPGFAELHQADLVRQTTPLLTYAEHRVSNAVESPDAHRGPLPCEALTFELTGYPATGPAGRYQASDLVEPDAAVPGRLRHRFTGPDVAYEAEATGDRRRRPIDWSRTLYRGDDLGGLLPLGHAQSLALPGESYRLAFTPGLLARVFQRPRPGQPAESLLPDPVAVLGGQAGDQGGYLRSQTLKADGRFPGGDPDDHWWIPSGRTFHSVDPADDAATELAHARRHFFLPRRQRDPFGQDAFVDFDAHDLLVAETRDPLGNRDTVEASDYRVLQPRLVSDPNRNRTEVAFDTLGLVVGTAVMGKPLPAPVEGDTLDGFVTDLTQAQLDQFFDAADPHAVAAALLKGATTRVVHDLDRYHRTRRANPDDPAKWQPARAATLARETHVGAPLPPHGLRIQLSFACSDGFGREIQKKIQAEPGPLDTGDPQAPVVAPRWVADGWTVYNNKGKPVRRYEPFFSATHDFEFGVMAGVSPVLFYDPAERLIATLHPNHTYEKVVFDPWQQTTYDVNDTCAARDAQTGDPRTDPDIGGYVSEYFRTQPDTWQTWHAQRIGGALGAHERDAAERAQAHADTPATAHFDTLGRPFLTVERNRVVCPGHQLDGTAENVATRVELDIEGNQREVRDAVQQAGDPLGRVVMRYAHDMLGNRLHEHSMEAGPRWTANDVAGKPIRAWDGRGHTFTTTYDALRRPVGQMVRGTTADSDPRTLNRDILIDKIEYGESRPDAEALNLRTRVYRQFDSAGVATHARLDANGDPAEAHDFKGNPLHSTRRLVRDYTAIPDWQLTPQLDDESFEAGTRYDALNRPIQSVAPHSGLARAGRNVIQRVFNEAGLLERVDVWLERATGPDALLDPGIEAPSPVGVAGIDYDAKGQRLHVAYKNGAGTVYGYDPLTFRLTRLLTRRDADAFPGDDPRPPVAGSPGRQVQNLLYTYDPAGNITHIQDDAQQIVFFRNQRVEPGNDYVYDARYRLIQATGREHLGQLAGGARRPPTAPDGPNAFHTRLDHPGDGNAMGTYVERYVYDAAGNLLRTQHRGGDPAHPGWTRAYDYLEPSLIEDGGPGAPPTTGNRLSRTDLGPDGAAEVYQHDAHGNLVRLPHLGGGRPGQNTHWDYEDRLRRADLAGGAVFCVYDATGQRVRKVWEKSPGRTEERLYLGGFEIFRAYDGPIGAGTASLERETLHVTDDDQGVALVETRTLDTAGDPAPRRLIRYQFGNHLGSVALELDERAQIISYEEYTPYGNSAYQAVRGRTETPKRYRYTGKERDEETGLYYHGSRYYAPWLGRWISADPSGLVDGVNVYAYANGNPIRFNDPSGNAGDDVNDPKSLTDKRAHAQPAAQPMTKKQARQYANKQASGHRKATGMNQGATVQAGHTAAARHASESGISKQDWDRQQMQDLHSRKGKGLDVSVTDQAGVTKTTTRHRSQEGLIDDAVNRTKAANSGKLTPQGQLDAAGEVKWRTENVPMDQRDVEALRKSGPAAPDKGPPVDPKTGKVISKEAKALKAGEELGEKALAKSGKGLKVLTKLGKAGRHFVAAVPVAGIVLGQASAAHAASQGDYTGAALDEAGFVPVVGDLLDAARGGMALGEALEEGLGISDIAAEHGRLVEGVARSAGLSQDASMIVGATGAAVSAITVAPRIAVKRTIEGWLR